SQIRVFFFFSSRRRHTRFSRDWSSDVCSSDLFQRTSIFSNLTVAQNVWVSAFRAFAGTRVEVLRPADAHPEVTETIYQTLEEVRSEERRVGKECGGRWLRERRNRDEGITRRMR